MSVCAGVVRLPQGELRQEVQIKSPSRCSNEACCCFRVRLLFRVARYHQQCIIIQTSVVELQKGRRTTKTLRGAGDDEFARSVACVFLYGIADASKFGVCAVRGKTVVQSTGN